MNVVNPYWRQLEVDLGDESGIIVPKAEEERAYFEMLRSSVREHATPAEWVSAIVEEPGFSHRELGSKISGYLLAKREGYWLVYESEERQYYCFWGRYSHNLGAYGVCGNPLYCWWE